MVDDVTQLKAELTDLNVKCQLARDNEIRFALQRSRLEAERAKLLVRIMEAMAPTAALPAVAALVATPTAPYHVVVQQAPIAHPAAPARGSVAVTDTAADAHQPKPAGLPSMQVMVETVLQAAQKGLRPRDIAIAIQKGWWPSAPRAHVSSVVWNMGQKGRLTKTGALYRLPELAARTNGHDH